MMEGSRFVRGRQIVELRVTLGRTASMPSPDASQWLQTPYPGGCPKPGTRTVWDMATDEYLALHA